MAVSSLVAASGGVSLQQQTFTSSGTFTLPSGYGSGRPLIVDIEICGGGGGGGSGAGGANTNAWGGAGGGSGVTLVYKAISLTANATVTIGAGGTGGTAVSNANGNNAANGGTSDVNSLYFAPGGGGGVGGLTSGTRGTGGGVRTAGIFIPGGFSSVVQNPGSGGGSGGSKADNTLSTDTPLFGGVRGLSGYNGSAEGVSAGPFEYSSGDNRDGGGLLSRRVTNNGTSTLSTVSLSYNELAILQRGGGGAGGFGQGPTAGGGLAGTINAGGQTGFGNTLSPRGTKDGQSATDNGCGAGGGAGMSSTGVLSGAGGNGAAGYCKITFWA